MSTLQRPMLHLVRSLPQGPELHEDVSGQHKLHLDLSAQKESVPFLDVSTTHWPKWYLDMSTSYETDLHPDVSTLQRPIQHLDVSTPQGPELHLMHLDNRSCTWT
jgi:hypothetical protein